MVRPLFVIASLLCASLALAQSQTPDTPAALCARYIAALAAEDMQAVRKCWTQWSDYEAMYKSLPADIRAKIKPKEIEFHKAYIAKRDWTIDDFVPKLIKRMKDEGIDLKSLKLKDQKAKVQTMEGKEYVNSFTIFAIDRNKVEIRVRIDDGAPWQDRWYFRDKPFQELEIIRGGKGRTTPANSRPDASKRRVCRAYSR